MSAKKLAATKKPTSAKPKKPGPPVFVFRLRDLTAARHARAAFDLPPEYDDLAFYVYDEAHERRAKALSRIPEPKVEEAIAKRALALVEAAATLIVDPGVEIMGEGPYVHGYHPTATVEEVVAAFEEDGFRVLGVANWPHEKRDSKREAKVKKRLDRATRALAGDVDAAVVAQIGRWIEEGGPEPEAPVTMGPQAAPNPGALRAPSTAIATLASVLVDEAVEQWTAMEERAFHLAARAKVIAGLASCDVDEGVGVDRWSLLSDRLRRAGWSDDEIELAWIDGLLGEISWPSATWYALAFLPRLDSFIERILARGLDRSPVPALGRLLVEPMDNLPAPLDGVYRDAVRARVEASPALARALSQEALGALDIPLPAPAPRPRWMPVANAAPSPRLDEVKRLYGVALPEELFAVWDLACSLSPKDPTSAFADDDLLGFSLVGPFDAIAGRTAVKPGLDYRLHWRFRFDPPEFVTVMSGNEDGLHFGYWFDEPAESPSFVAFYYAHDAFELTVGGMTLFEAMRGFLERAHAASIEGMYEEPEYATSYVKRLVGLGRLREKLVAYGTGDRAEAGAAYQEKYNLRGYRSLQTVAMTPEGMGVVAPPARHQALSKAGEGLAKAIESKAEAKRLVQEALDLAQKGFPASALELGRHMWARRRDEAAYALLDAAYAGLDRPALREILAVHRAHRDLRSVDVLVE